ncbi:MAG: hypothetical protein V7767_03635 [Leeuwenhoekiella sp.]
MIKNRILGIALVAAGLFLGYYLDNDLAGFAGGILSAIGLLLAIKGTLRKKSESTLISSK